MTGSDFPDLPPLGDLLFEDPFWSYPSRCGGGAGFAHLRVWRVPGSPGQRVAVVTETGVGVTITNSIDEIWAALTALYDGELILIEHWPEAESPSDGEHLDQAVIRPRHRPGWRRVWPVPTSNPDHDQLTAWMDLNGHHITTG